MSDFEWLREDETYPFEIFVHDDWGPITGITGVTVRLRDMFTGDAYLDFDLGELTFKSAAWVDDTLDLVETPAGSGQYRALFDFSLVDLELLSRLRAEYSYNGEIRGTQELILTKLITFGQATWPEFVRLPKQCDIDTIDNSTLTDPGQGKLTRSDPGGLVSLRCRGSLRTLR